MMYLYKYRPLSTDSKDNQDFIRLEKILNSGSFYCSSFDGLNDPMEGAFTYIKWPGHEARIKKIVDEIIDQKSKHKILSLAKDQDNLLMWAHYASGMSGVCIEIELPSHEGRAKPVCYTQYVENIIGHPEEDNDKTAEYLLLRKAHLWSYEREYRIIEKNVKIQLRITRVLLGERFNASKFECIIGKSIKSICELKNYPLIQTEIDWSCQAVREARGAK